MTEKEKISRVGPILVKYVLRDYSDGFRGAITILEQNIDRPKSNVGRIKTMTMMIDFTVYDIMDKHC